MSIRTRPYGHHVGKLHGRWKNGIPCRCTACGRRRTLSMRPDHYYKPSYASCCGRLMRIDWYRASGAEGRDQRCTCNAYPGQRGECYPHRRGSMFCDHGPAGKAGFSIMDQDSAAFGEWLQAGCPEQHWEHAA